jgi:uncharacterized repeat protein (TIGR03803 family)
VYGTTPSGGSSDLGTVFKVDRAGSFTSLHSFDASEGSGLSASIVAGSDGSLYGTTGRIVFEIDSAGSFASLPFFQDQSPVPSGYCIPSGSLSGPVVLGGDGALYGISTRSCTSAVVGWYRSDTLFRIDGAGVVTPLHRFGDGSFDGLVTPSLVLGRDGALYGITDLGGSEGLGSVFRIDHAGGFSTLHSFGGADGSHPRSLVLGSDGAFYGTTEYGGSSGFGTIFRIDPTGAFASWHSFEADDGVVGGLSKLVLGSDGALYGTQGWLEGPVFRVDSAGSFTIVHSFGGADGFQPFGALVEGSDGAFYGTAANGGPGGGGLVYRISFFDFTGFLRPVRNPPVSNRVKAGRAVPLRFRLGGNQGLAVLAKGAPSVRTVPCDASAGVNKIRGASARRPGSLRYAATRGRYTYWWKADESWAGTCQELALELVDGTIHRAIFRFEDPRRPR